MKWNLSIKKTLKFFVTIIILLTLLSIIGQCYKFEINAGHDRYIVKMINLDAEMNFPTLYATSTLFICSFLIFLISISKKQFNDKFFIHWFGLGLIFFFMGMDEILILHEQLSAPVRGTLKTENILYFSWRYQPGFF